MLMVINKHTQFAGPGRTNSNVVGYPMMPVYMSKMGGFFFLTFGVIVLIASLFTINPIWNYGPYDPSPVSAGTQPDWYIGFADGALRLVPPHLEFVLWDRTWSFNILLPARHHRHLHRAGADLPLHRGVGHGRQARAPHRPTARATPRPVRRSASPASSSTAVLWAAASSDIIATHFRSRWKASSTRCRRCLIVGPIVGYFIAKRIAIALQKKDREIALHGVRVRSRRAACPVASTSRFTSRSTPTSASSWSTTRPMRRSWCARTTRAAFRGTRTSAPRCRAGSSKTAWFPSRSPRSRPPRRTRTTARGHRRRRNLELQGMHDRAGVPDAPHHPIDDGSRSETAGRLVEHHRSGTTSRRRLTLIWKRSGEE